LLSHNLNLNVTCSITSIALQVVGKNVDQDFVVVGSVKDPRVGFQQPFINFGRLLLGGKARETLKLVNKEHIPFSFNFDKASYGHQPGEDAPTIFINPEQGVRINILFRILIIIK
jgi:hypothetical protein